ncbi:hypothetical protein K502DRAFT_349539 [Neoconidiobolus thromboides FSU 785]|nr:hypothetical protein K502DRAFT_349539 [Neoconidiobolus thromboides FSU 785]
MKLYFFGVLLLLIQLSTCSFYSRSLNFKKSILAKHDKQKRNPIDVQPTVNNSTLPKLLESEQLLTHDNATSITQNKTTITQKVKKKTNITLKKIKDKKASIKKIKKYSKLNNKLNGFKKKENILEDSLKDEKKVIKL